MPGTGRYLRVSVDGKVVAKRVRRHFRNNREIINAVVGTVTQRALCGRRRVPRSGAYQVVRHGAFGPH